MRRVQTWILFLAAVGVGGAVSAGPVPVTDSTQRFVFEVFSVLPPKGEDWFVLEQAANRIRFAKLSRETASRGDTAFASADGLILNVRFQSPAEFLEFVEKSPIQERVLQRWRPLRSGFKLDSSLGPTCVQYEGVFEDAAVPQFPGSVFIINTRGFDCLHPHRPGVVVRITYGTRFLQGSQPPPIKAEVEPVLKSLVFTPIK